MPQSIVRINTKQPEGIFEAVALLVRAAEKELVCMPDVKRSGTQVNTSIRFVEQSLEGVEFVTKMVLILVPRLHLIKDDRLIVELIYCVSLVT